MIPADLPRFRRLCRVFRTLSVVMVASTGSLLLLMHVVAPALLWLRGDAPDRDFPLPASAVLGIPPAFYLYGVWAVGRAVGRLADGDLVQATLSAALRRVGGALFLGGSASVFLVYNLLRWFGETRSGWLHFDVPGMTLGMIGAALFLLGRVVDAAAAIEDELRATSARYAAAKAELDEMI